MLDFELSLKGIIVEDLNSSRQISRAYAAVEWLKTDPKSRWRAELLGSDTNIGWATDTYLLAGIQMCIRDRLRMERPLWSGVGVR